MKYELASNEDFEIKTKSGGVVKVPASASDGTLALLSDILVKSIKLNGTALTPDANGAVDVPALPLAGGTMTGDISTANAIWLTNSGMLTGILQINGDGALQSLVGGVNINASFADIIKTANGSSTHYLGNSGDQTLNHGSLRIVAQNPFGIASFEVDGASHKVGISPDRLLLTSPGHTFEQEFQFKEGVLALLADTMRFSTNVAYAVGNVVFYNGSFYRCTTAHSAGAWNASHFTEVLGGLSTGTPTAPNLTDQSADGQIANKKYVDDKVAGTADPVYDNAIAGVFSMDTELQSAASVQDVTIIKLSQLLGEDVSLYEPAQAAA